MIIDILVFSLDRACQTDLLLKTMMEKVHLNKRIHLLYLASNNFYNEGFEILKDYHPYVTFYKQVQPFEVATKRILNNFKGDYVLFDTDDDVYIDDLSSEEFRIVEAEYLRCRIHCISIRMHDKIDYCYPALKAMEIPEFIEKDKYLLWDWTKAKDQHTCWGYAHSAISHIYERHEIQKLINSFNFKNVNQMEAGMNTRRWFDKPLLISFKDAKCYNVQNNYVQGPNKGKAHQGNDIKTLNKQFLAGKRLSTSTAYGLKINQAHGTLDYRFE